MCLIANYTFHQIALPLEDCADIAGEFQLEGRWDSVWQITDVNCRDWERRNNVTNEQDFRILRRWRLWCTRLRKEDTKMYTTRKGEGGKKGVLVSPKITIINNTK